MSFTRYKSFFLLKQLAKAPPDLSKKGGFTGKRIIDFSMKALGLTLLYSGERVDAKILQALCDLAVESKAVSKMEAMQDGEIINRIEGFPSENRAVLHTAMRDFFFSQKRKKIAQESSQAAWKEIQKLEHFLQKFSASFTDIVQVGIGGSDLGPRALYIALKAYKKKGKQAHFVSNVDPDDVFATLEKLNLKKTLFVIVSKSGNTLETLTNEAFIRKALKRKGLDPKKHMIAVTAEKSPMDDPSQYLASFYIWDYVGGRYSATSMVGAVSLSFTLGISRFKQLLKGASAMDKHALVKDPLKNLPLLSALLGIWNHNFLDLPAVAILPYSEALSRFPAHLQQLDMESNGKSVDIRGRKVHFSTGPLVWGEPGTNGQHSFYQLIHQGILYTSLEFLGFKESQYGKDLDIQKTSSQEKLLSNLFAQSVALAQGKKEKNPNQNFVGNRPHRMLLAKKLDPEMLGKLLAYYEHKVAFQGFIWGINSFDQEGVQLGKTLAKRVMELFKGKKGFSEGEAFFKKLKEL